MDQELAKGASAYEEISRDQENLLPFAEATMVIIVSSD
jgi:hypothetical protein